MRPTSTAAATPRASTRTNTGRLLAIMALAASLVPLALAATATPAGALPGPITTAQPVATPATPSGSDFRPYAVEAGRRINGDAFNDIVYSQADTSNHASVQVMFGNASGGYDPPVKIFDLPFTSGNIGSSGDGYTQSLRVESQIIPGLPANKNDIVVSHAGDKSIFVLKGHSDGTFDAPVVIPLTVTPNVMRMRLLDADGRQDFVVGENTKGSPANPLRVNIVMSTGDGTWGAATESAITPGWNLNDITTGDFTGDAAIDIAVVGNSFGGARLWLLKNNGSGGFLAPVFTQINGGGVVVPIFYDDQDLDLVDSDGSKAWLLENDGTGTFSVPAQDQYSPMLDHSRTTGENDNFTDNDHDGQGEFVLPRPSGGALVMKRNADQSAGAPKFLFDSWGTLPSIDPAVDNSIATASVAWNVTSDLVAANIGTGSGRSSSISVLPRDNRKSSLAFLTPNQFEVGWGKGVTSGTGVGYSQVALADIDGDTDDDLVTVKDGKLLYATNNGDRTFAPANQFINGPSNCGDAWIETADTNNDGKLDFILHGCGVFGGAIAEQTTPGTVAMHSVILNQDARRKAFADFNNDGRADIAWSVEGFAARAIKVMLSVPGSDSTNSATLLTGDPVGDPMFPVIAGDLDGDNKADVAMFNNRMADGSIGNRMQVWRGNGDGTFQSPVETTGLPYFHAAGLADMDGDGKPDVVGNTNQCDSGCGHLVVLHNTSTVGTVSFSQSFDGGASGGNQELDIADVNRDGIPDAVTGTNGQGLEVWTGRADGGFDRALHPTGRAAVNSTAVGALDADADLDFVTTQRWGSGSFNGDRSFAVIENTGTGKFGGPTFKPVTPTRLLDTRIPAQGPKLGPGDERTVQITGVAGVPVGATSATLNITAVFPTAGSHLTIWPDGEGMPTVSSLNFKVGEIAPNNVQVKIGANGKIRMRNNAGSVDILVDINGYGANDETGATYRSVNPFRALDTREAGQGPKLGPGEERDVQITGVGGVPGSGVAAVAINATAVFPSAASHLTIFPKGGTTPVVSTLNYFPGDVRPNGAIIPVGTGGKITLRNNSGDVDILVDINGYFASALSGATFQAVTPSRILDTREVGQGPKLGPGEERDIQIAGAGGVPATGATAVAINATVVFPDAASHLSIWPSGEAVPTVSSLNYFPGNIRPNGAVIKIGANGKIRVKNNAGNVDLLIDVGGWYG